MTTDRAGPERVYRGLLRLYPARFRARFSDDMVQLFGDQLRQAHSHGPPAAVAGTWLRAVTDIAVTAASEHIRRDRTVAHSLAVAPSTSSRLLGLVGILGGLVLVAVFLIDIEPAFNTARLLLFNAGAIAIVIAVHRRQSLAGPRMAAIAAAAALVANAWHLGMIVLAIGRTEPIGAGQFGQVYFLATLSMWLADAWFGLATLRLGVLARWGALALGIGSLLAIIGIDRLGMNSGEHPTIFGTLPLVGIALNGIGWILLGIDVATRRSEPAKSPTVGD
jgi:hypothetical protein